MTVKIRLTERLRDVECSWRLKHKKQVSDWLQTGIILLVALGRWDACVFVGAGSAWWPLQQDHAGSPSAPASPAT